MTDRHKREEPCWRMPKKKTRIFEGTNDGEDNPLKVLSSFNVYYGHGSRETFYIQKADREGLTEEVVLKKIEEDRKKKRKVEAEGGGGGKGKRAKAAAHPLQRRPRKVDSRR